MRKMSTIPVMTANTLEAGEQPRAPAMHRASSHAAPVAALVSRNVTVKGRRTSVRLEPAMWHGLQEICKRERASLHEVCTAIAAQRGHGASLTAAIRVFIMAYFRAAATDDGHQRAGHGNGTPQGIIATILREQETMRAPMVR